MTHGHRSRCLHACRHWSHFILCCASLFDAKVYSSSHRVIVSCRLKSLISRLSSLNALHRANLSQCATFLIHCGAVVSDRLSILGGSFESFTMQETARKVR